MNIVGVVDKGQSVFKSEDGGATCKSLPLENFPHVSNRS